MKKIFTSCVIILYSITFAQTPGKAGELLKNEASAKEMESSSGQKRNLGDKSTTNSGLRSAGNQANRNPSFRRPGNSNYRWNQNYGYAEVFLRIPEYGYFSVELGDQLIANDSGRFRFFDLSSGRIPILIYDNGFLIYRTTLNIRNNTRMVLDFFTNSGLYLLDSYPLQNGYYGFNDWNDIWNNPYGSFGNNGFGNYSNVMDDNAFSEFVEVMKRNSAFDDSKIAFINQQTRYSMFTSQQISILAKNLNFDKNKLSLAKLMFSKCVDRQKYFIVGEALDFEKSRRELMDFVSRN